LIGGGMGLWRAGLLAGSSWSGREWGLGGKRRMLSMLVRSAVKLVQSIAHSPQRFANNTHHHRQRGSSSKANPPRTPPHHSPHQSPRSAQPAYNHLASTTINTIQKTHTETRIEQPNNHAGCCHSHFPSQRTSCAIAALSSHSDFTTRAAKPCFSASARKVFQSLTSASLSPETR